MSRRPLRVDDVLRVVTMGAVRLATCNHAPWFSCPKCAPVERVIVTATAEVERMQAARAARRPPPAPVVLPAITVPSEPAPVVPGVTVDATSVDVDVVESVLEGDAESLRVVARVRRRAT